jgi:hypothetical protein
MEQGRVTWSLLQVPLAAGKTQHAVRERGGTARKRALGYRKITKGRDLKQYIENTCHDRYDPASRGKGLCSLLPELFVENQSSKDSNGSHSCPRRS